MSRLRLLLSHRLRLPLEPSPTSAPAEQVQAGSSGAGAAGDAVADPLATQGDAGPGREVAGPEVAVMWEQGPVELSLAGVPRELESMVRAGVASADATGFRSVRLGAPTRGELESGVHQKGAEVLILTSVVAGGDRYETPLGIVAWSAGDGARRPCRQRRGDTAGGREVAEIVSLVNWPDGSRGRVLSNPIRGRPAPVDADEVAEAIRALGSAVAADGASLFRRLSTSRRVGWRSRRRSR